MNVLTSALGVDLYVTLLLKGGLLAGLVVVAARYVPLAPRFRSPVWTASGLALLVLPVVSFVTPVWGPGLAQIPSTWVGTEGGDLPVATWLLMIWAGGVAVVASRFVIELVRIAVITRRAAPCADARVLAMIREIRGALKLRRRVCVRLRAGRAVPATWGTFRPVVLLPEGATGWPEERLRAVLWHELTHVRRYDFLRLLFEEAVRAVYWFNPLVWLMLGRSRRDQEMACDETVVVDFMAPADYARQLVAVARFTVLDEGVPEAALPVVRGGTLRDRVRLVLDRENQRFARPNRWLLVAGVLALLLSVVPLARTTVLSCPVEHGPSAGSDDPGFVTAAGPSTTTDIDLT